MRLFITGATGLIGRRLVVDRLERGDEVVIVSRQPERAARIFAAQTNRNITVVNGNPAVPGPWQTEVEGCDAVVHFAGAGIADRRWSKAYKKAIASSRIDSTHQVVQAISHASYHRPKTLISGSAIGYYGNTGELEVDESAPAGRDFLAKLSIEWEAQALRAESLGVRVILLRTAVVLDNRGGALAKMKLPFKYFAGGPIGRGQQYMSWIHWRDLVGLIDVALENHQVIGPVNASSPGSVRNREFSRLLGLSLHRPSWLPAPKWALRIVLGEVARYLSMSQRIKPARALQAGYEFLYPELEPALESLIRRVGDPIQLRSRSTMSLSMRLNLGPAPRRSGESTAEVAPKTSVPMAPIRLIAVDVDGTLLRSNASIAKGVVQACRAAMKQGCMIVPATARPPRAMRPILQSLNIDGPVINYHGAVIWNPKTNSADHHEAIDSQLAHEIVNSAITAQPNIVIGLEVLDRWYVNRIDESLAAFDQGAVRPDGVGPLDSVLSESVTKINLLGTPDETKKLLEVIREKFWRIRRVAVFLTDPQLIQITNPMVDKGIALQRVAQRAGIKREEVMAIGDGSNDMGMIEWAGFGVAVANAYPAVKELADAIVPSNDEMGVARAIQRYVLTQRAGSI